MVLFVDLDEVVGRDPPHLQGGKLVWGGTQSQDEVAGTDTYLPPGGRTGPAGDEGMEAHEPAVTKYPSRNPVTEALGCYPIVVAIASSIDLNTLDNLSRTCRQIRHALLQYRRVLLLSTLHCLNEELPVEREETLRYRARAGNWYYMEDTGRTSYNGKSGRCARDMVAECRRCKAVVCRNCAIKPPAPIVLRERHRRLCLACTRVPIGYLVKPELPSNVSIHSDAMQQAMCKCDSDGVWLCQPCGRTIRGEDYGYRSIWKWRHQYGELLGGLGTGIGEGDRGVTCGRDSECIAAREREQETDCDAADAREAESFLQLLGTSPSPSPQPAAPIPAVQFPWTAPGGHGSTSSLASTPGTIPGSSTGSFSSLNSLSSSTTGHGGGHTPPLPAGTPAQQLMVAESAASRRTPSPGTLGPGYARHEIEGIGGVVKTKLVQMVRVGACVPVWEDETASRNVLGREVSGSLRSWCGWCWRVIPGKKDYETDRQMTGGDCQSTPFSGGRRKGISSHTLMR